MKRIILTLLACALTSSAAFAQDRVQPPTVSLTVYTGKTTAVVNWTAPGDACTNATLAEYDVRYSTSSITECNFTSATQFSGIPTPSSPGGEECVNAGSLTCNTTYYFAWKVKDSAGNWSDIATASLATKSCASHPEIFCP